MSEDSQTRSLWQRADCGLNRQPFHGGAHLCSTLGQHAFYCGVDLHAKTSILDRCLAPHVCWRGPEEAGAVCRTPHEVNQVAKSGRCESQPKSIGRETLIPTD